MIVVEAEHHEAFIVWDARVASYTAEKEFGWSFPCTGRNSSRRGATVEIHRRLGREPQRAILGGIKQPTATGRLSLVIPASGPAGDLPQVASRSLSRAPFSAGLFDEEITTVVSGLLYSDDHIGGTASDERCLRRKHLCDGAARHRSGARDRPRLEERRPLRIGERGDSMDTARE